MGSSPKFTRNNSSYASLLQHCSRERLLEGGLQLHADMIKAGFDSDTYLQSSLLGLYVRCESLDCVRTLFDTAGSLRTNLISWNSIITMYFRLGLIKEALSVYLELRRSGFAPDQYTLSVLIGAVQEQGELCLGIQLHCVCIKFGYGEEEFVANSLIKMYAAFGRTGASSRVFEKIRGSGSSVAWNSMIARHVENELYEDGLKLYNEMINVGSATTPLTLSSVLRACAAREQISEGKQVHSRVMVHGFVPNVILETVLLEFYSRCGELDDARKVFERMEDKNVLTWNSMIRGYSQEGYIEEAFELFRAKRRGGIASDKFTFPALLSGAATGEDCKFLQEFRSIHACIIKTGLESDKFVGASLVTMYSRNHCLEEARSAFDETSSKDIGVWASMISACAKNKQGAQAIDLFSEMLLLGITPSPSIFPSLFGACGELSALEMGKQIHGYVSKNGLRLLDSAAQNSLVTMYSNCGLLIDARRIFSSIPDPNVVSFNSMISALAQHGHAAEAYELSRTMELVGIRPDGVTLLNLLSAFNHAGLVEEGLESFSSMEETYRIEPTYQHYACVVDSLARAGEIDKAFGLIGAMPFEPDASLRRIVLGACAKHRNLETGKRIAEQLVELEPDEATNYVLIANVYARVGRCAEATKIRNVMVARGLQKEEGFSWIEIDRRIYKFGVEDRSHPRSEDIYVKLGELTTEMKAAGGRCELHAP